jgi:hypothetical protein
MRHDCPPKREPEDFSFRNVIENAVERARESCERDPVNIETFVSQTLHKKSS